jgi:threonine 3-dehydrogenase
MLALRKLAPEAGLALREIPEPAAPPHGEVVVKVAVAGICGTDLHVADWTAGYAAMTQAMPVTLGHEFMGTVARLGDGVATVSVGDRVVVRPSVVCGTCERCRNGQAEDCVTRRGIGIMRDGGFAAFTVVPAENCVPVPDTLADRLAALTEPMTVSAEAVDTAGVKPGDTVLIIGPGTIGQGAALFAEAAGAKRIVIAGRDDAARLTTLREMGFADVADTGGGSLREGLVRAGLPLSYDRIIEAAGVPTLVGEALDLLALRGVLTICGIHPTAATVDLTALVRRHQQIRGTYRAPLATWPRVIAFLTANSERVSRMVTEEVPLSEALAAFARAKSRSASKIMLRP